MQPEMFSLYFTISKQNVISYVFSIVDVKCFTMQENQYSYYFMISFCINSDKGHGHAPSQVLNGILRQKRGKRL